VVRPYRLSQPTAVAAVIDDEGDDDARVVLTQALKGIA
jgi:hypothetical protein